MHKAVNFRTWGRLRDVNMPIIEVTTGTALYTTVSFHAARQPRSDQLVVLHHGICHTREHFIPLIEALNDLGLSTAVIDQQSEPAGWLRRNFIGLNSYYKGMAAAVQRIRADYGEIGSYVLHSTGALIGENLQQQNPALRRPTVLMAPIPVRGAWPITWRIMTRYPFAYLWALVTLNIVSLAQTPKRAKALFFDQTACDKMVVDAMHCFKPVPFWLYLQLSVRGRFCPNMRNDCRPKLLITSPTDEIFHPNEFYLTRERYPQMEEHQLRGGHDFFIVDPVTTAERIAEFHL